MIENDSSAERALVDKRGDDEGRGSRGIDRYPFMASHVRNVYKDQKKGVQNYLFAKPPHTDQP